MRLLCYFCGKSVSNEVPEETVIRAVLACPECVETGHVNPCAVTGHGPMIVHRTGGPSVQLKNTCGKCGHMIQNVNGVWMLDPKRERR